MIPQEWLHQPPAGAEIDWGDPLNRGLVCAATDGYEAVTGQAYKQPGKVGRRGRYNANDQSFVIAHGELSTSNLTVLLVGFIGFGSWWSKTAAIGTDSTPADGGVVFKHYGADPVVEMDLRNASGLTSSNGWGSSGYTNASAHAWVTYNGTDGRLFVNTDGSGGLTINRPGPLVYQNSRATLIDVASAGRELYALFIWNRLLPAAERAAVVANYWRRYRFAPLVFGAGGSISATPPTGGVTASGLAASVQLAGSVAATPATGAVTVAGLAPAVSVTGTINATPAVGNIDAQGLAPAVSVTGAVAANPSAGQVSVSGLSAAVTVAGAISATPVTGGVSLSGLAPAVVVALRVDAGLGAVAASGLTPSVTVDAGGSIAVTPQVGAVTVIGLPAEVSGIASGAGRPRVLWAKSLREQESEARSIAHEAFGAAKALPDAQRAEARKAVRAAREALDAAPLSTDAIVSAYQQMARIPEIVLSSGGATPELEFVAARLAQLASDAAAAKAKLTKQNEDAVLALLLAA